MDLPENQPHRGEVAKLLVHPSARRLGLGRLLMQAVEEAARGQGRSVLVLDTSNAAAERLYEGLGWQRVGAVPVAGLSSVSARKPGTTNHETLVSLFIFVSSDFKSAVH